MTVIAAIHQPGVGTWIGSDRLFTIGNFPIVESEKWYLHGGWAVGAAGSKRTLNLLERHHQTVLADANDAVDVATRVRQLLRDDAYNVDDEIGPQTMGGSYMVACAGCAWAVTTDFAVTAVPDDVLWTAGSGALEARGAGHALSAHGVTDGRVLVTSAIRAACTLDVHCGGDPWVHCLRGP